jgi:hypothetical protein
MKNQTLKAVPFSAVAIGQEFLWGARTAERCNWGQKRSSRTADYRPRLSGELTDWKGWAYWKQTEAVWVSG